jgi:mRNA interferase RelE/StbE
LIEFRIAETPKFQKQVASTAYRAYYARFKERIYPGLRENPYFGPNIKRLKGSFSSIYRYRIGDYRLFYAIDAQKKLVFVLTIAHRRDAYR